MVWYSHLFLNFPQFVVIHTVKSFGVVNKAEVFLELSCFLPCLFNFYAEYFMRNTGLEEAQAEIKIARRNINRHRRVDSSALSGRVS